MYDREFMNMLLTAASRAEIEGFTASAEAFRALAADCALLEYSTTVGVQRNARPSPKLEQIFQDHKNQNEALQS
jgi:hypothetical protein